ncbi:MAG TPA: nickel pincer cofactor biosynthesis protein LarC [Jatrophihabitans sp.]|nr:nickel pincer cofactor biosynthesis protein LarC [Jatrophihabitans sp.]
MSTALWVDAGNGAAGDMLLGALLDAGADLAAVRAAVSRLGVEPIEIDTEQVRRHGLRACRALVRAPASTVARGTADIARLLDELALPPVQDRFARDVFDRLAEAEARVHGVAVDEVHFHEVGALDSLADVIGCAVALDSLGLLAGGVQRWVSRVALGGGSVATAHGRLPVPVPATLELLARAGAPVGAGPGDRELCTPTGAALLAALATGWGDLPDLRVRAHGTGAGTADPAGRPNVLRVVLGELSGPDTARWREDDLRQVEATVDDLDPRLWPGVLDDLVAAGAADAWLTPVLMRKGRPGHVVSALVPAAALDAVFRCLVTATTTLGARVHPVARRALARTSIMVELAGSQVRVKCGLLGDAAVTVQPEFDEVLAAARTLGLPPAEVLRQVQARATQVLAGQELPGND